MLWVLKRTVSMSTQNTCLNLWEENNHNFTLNFFCLSGPMLYVSAKLNQKRKPYLIYTVWRYSWTIHKFTILIIKKKCVINFDQISTFLRISYFSVHASAWMMVVNKLIIVCNGSLIWLTCFGHKWRKILYPQTLENVQSAKYLGTTYFTISPPWCNDQNWPKPG